MTNRGAKASSESVALRSKGSYSSQRDVMRGCSCKHKRHVDDLSPGLLRALAFPASGFLTALNNSHMSWGNKKMCEITTAWIIHWAGGAPNQKPSWLLFPTLSISAISVALESFQEYTTTCSQLLKFHSAFKVQQSPPLRVLP